MAIIRGADGRLAMAGWPITVANARTASGAAVPGATLRPPLRSAYRDGNTADARLDNLGVRVARTLDVP